MTQLTAWIAGARPRTLPAAVAPVFAGTGVALWLGVVQPGRAALAAAVALALQVGVNYANDYSDGVKGTDAARVGPTRLVASGLARARTVKLAAFAAFALAGLAGLALVAWCGQWWLLAVGVAAIAAAWFYTGGSRPYGYRGLGDVGVFVFFGLVAVAGTCYTQALAVPWLGWLAACAMGLIACALLMVNNIRDIASDTTAGKRTLAVRLGDRRARYAYAAELWLALLGTLGVVAGGGLAGASVAWIVVAGCAALAATVWVIRLTRTVLGGATGHALVAVLGATGMLELALGLGMLAALAW